MTAEENELLKDIHTCLMGNKLNGQVGLIDKVDALDRKVGQVENRIHSLEKKQKPIILRWLILLFSIKG